MRILQSKFTKTNPKDFQNRGAHARRAGPGSAFGFSSHSRIIHSYGDVTIAGEGLQILIYARHSGMVIE